jgi:DNA-3-methyladenine glycosylase II
MPYIKHLSKDIKLKPVIKSIGRIELRKDDDVFSSLVATIMSQQLSTKVARVFHNRYIELHGKKLPTPEQLLNTPFEKLRAIGLSNAKSQYIQNIAKFAIDSGLNVKQLAKLSNEEVIEYLTQIKGVGRWTAEMILMFTLGREDVFPVDDLGIQTAIIKLYGLRTKEKKKLNSRLIEIAKSWSPYRTYACVYLWRWRDGE